MTGDADGFKAVRRTLIALGIALVVGIAGLVGTLSAINGIANGAPLRWWFWLCAPVTVACAAILAIGWFRFGRSERAERPANVVRTSPSYAAMGLVAGSGDFQRRRVRLIGGIIGTGLTVCVGLVIASIVLFGAGDTFGGDSPVRFPVLVGIALLFVTPILISAVFRSKRFGVEITTDELVVESWWRTHRWNRDAILCAEPMPAEMQWSNGWFSAQGNSSAPATTWLWLTDETKPAVQLGVTTGTIEQNEATARRINAWLGVDFS